MPSVLAFSIITLVAGTTYVASKHAVSAMTKSTVFMYTNNKICVNGLAPGAIATNIASTMTNLNDFGNARIGAVSALNPGVNNLKILPMPQYS
ncbi:SDR family NAD(P)-dependent oxidoreductase [Aerococcus viridans]